MSIDNYKKTAKIDLDQIEPQIQELEKLQQKLQDEIDS